MVKNTQIRHFWSQIWVFLFPRKILKLGKIEGPDFKFDNSFLKFLPKNTQIKHFFVPNLAIFFFFSQDVAVRQIRGYWLQTWQHYFQSPAKKYPNQTFSFVHQTLQRHKYFTYDIIFFKSQPKITQMLNFPLETQRLLLFKWNFEWN